MKFIRLSTIFLVASTAQGFIVFFGEYSGLSQFKIEFTPERIAHHILVGQILGYTIYYLFNHSVKKKIKWLGFLVGCSYSMIAWVLVITAGITTGLIQSEWLQFSGIITTIVAFLVYGSIVGLMALK